MSEDVLAAIEADVEVDQPTEGELIPTQPPVGGVPVDPVVELEEAQRYDGAVLFDGSRLRQVTPDGREVDFLDLAEERQAWAEFTRAAQTRRVQEVSRHRVPDPAILAIEPNPPAYRQAVDAFLEPVRDSFSFDALHQTYMSVEFFLGWVSVVNAHRSVEGARVYSSGCGLANTVVAYHAFGAASVVGTEIDQRTVELGNYRVRGLPGAEVIKIDPSKPLPFEDGSFDIIESLDVIEHVEDLRPYALELERVLAPGGVAVIAAPNRMFPVEQHTGVKVVPWLPFGVGNALARMGSKSPWASAEQRDRRKGVAEVRTGNVSWLTIRQMALMMNMTAARIHRLGHPGWPMNADPAWVEWWARQRKIGILAPTRQVIGLLTKPPFAASS